MRWLAGRHLELIALIAMSITVPRMSHAQEERRGQLEGSVMDSVHARPLAGVRVVAVGALADVQRATTSDSAGRYRIDSLPAGRYAVGFESPLLDSLEVSISPRQVTVTQAGAITVDLALPPAAKVRAAVCPGISLPPETGAIVGHVVSAETESSLPGVTIAMSWREMGFDKATLRPFNRERTASIVTDDAGWYRACGVPTGGWLSMQLQHEGRIGPVLRTLVDDTLGVAVRHLSFSATAARSVGDSSASTAEDTPPMSGTAKLSGGVFGPGGAPVAEAEVRVRGANGSARTNSLGSYSLSALPAGTQMLEVRRVGYAVVEAHVELREGVTTTRDVRLQRIVNLDSVRVVAARARYPEFNEHREHGLFGVFLGPDQIEKQRVSYASDIIEKIPGFIISGHGIHAQVVGGRGVSTFAGACKVNIIIDEVHNLSINDVSAANIGAIAAYREGELAPPGYDRGCGAIVIWTKR